jgi:primosomal protein N' (replication factor Y)
VLVQTSCPAEPAILKASQHDYPGFAAAELEHRRAMRAPPFEHLTRVIIRGPDEQAVLAEARRIADMVRSAIAERSLPVRILGPAPAPVSRLKGSYRFHLQLSATAVDDIQQVWRAVTKDGLKLPANVEFAVDMDPINLR